VDVGPAQPLPKGESVGELTERLVHALQAYESNPPFTMQRLAELLLEPQKQYSRLDKLVGHC
jgi:serine/threonine-protein phosphatase 4 regulatory subunit 2